MIYIKTLIFGAATFLVTHTQSQILNGADFEFNSTFGYGGTNAGYGMFWGDDVFTLPEGWNLNGLSADPVTGQHSVVYHTTRNYHNTITPASGKYFMAFANTDFYGPTTRELNNNISGLTPGQTYEISFSYAGLYAPGIPGNPGIIDGEWSVSTKDSIATTYDALAGATLVPSTQYYQTNWRTGTHTFTATNTSTFLNFIGLAAGGPTEIFLDNIRVTPVPEPSSIITIATLLTALVVRRKRQLL